MICDKKKGQQTSEQKVKREGNETERFTCGCGTMCCQLNGACIFPLFLRNFFFIKVSVSQSRLHLIVLFSLLAMNSITIELKRLFRGKRVSMEPLANLLFDKHLYDNFYIQILYFLSIHIHVLEASECGGNSVFFSFPMSSNKRYKYICVYTWIKDIRLEYIIVHTFTAT